MASADGSRGGTSEADLQLVLEPGAEVDRAAYVALVRTLTAMLRRELSVPVTVRSLDRLEPDLDREERTRGDGVAIAAMVLAIPGSALALYDLATRDRVKGVLRRVLARAKQESSSVQWRTAVDEMALPGDDERSVDDLVDKLASAQEGARDGRGW